MAKDIIFDDKSRKALKKGIDKVAKAVTMTLGPRGRSVVIERSYGAPQVTLDGVTVAKEIELEDKYENLGANLLKQASEKTNDNVGDGTTTSIVLAQSMIEEGEKAISEKGFNVIALAEELNQGAEKIVAELEKQSEQVKDEKKVGEVATLSAKDPEIGKLIAEVIKKVGKDGIITIEDSNTVQNSYETVEGMQFDRGYISPYMINEPEKMQVRYDNPYILITDKKISAVKEIVPIIEKMAQSGKKDLVIVADDVEGEALAVLVVNKIKGIFNTLALKAPGFGDKKKEILEDLAILTGGKVITEDLGLNLESAELSMLGRASTVISDKDNTTIVGGKGKKSDIEKRVEQLRTQIENTESKYDREKLEERLGKLSGGVAVIRVGAPTESAQKELKQRVEDAVSATKAAMEEGVVPGGGMALFNISLENKTDGKDNDIKQAALGILHKAMEAPAVAIITNSGISDPAQTIAEIKSKKSETKDKEKKNWVGFNGKTNEIEDLKKAGIIDPLKVTKTAFMNAVSVAANYLTIGAAVTEIPKKESEMGGMGGGMPGMM